MNAQRFGGPWTEQKLDALERYLRAYLTIFTRNPRAAKFRRHYVDAFAGSGTREARDTATTHLDLDDANEAVDFMDGSVRKVLSIDQEFHKYWFVEKDPVHADSLRRMIRRDFASREEKCKVIQGDANEFLVGWCDRLGPMDRAVVFLDPYGMAVQWTTIEKLAKTQKVDLWMLFPSSSVIRMLPRQGPPDEAWSRRLNELFGDDSWRSEFYKETPRKDLFGLHITFNREVTEETVARFLLRRLKKIFAGVVKEPLILRNSRGSPLFMLVFAAGNPRGAKTAISIAGDIIKNA
ncbi:MAG TPA: three-Cys-motif partner protein TcmP [Gammaproteobacteria bacterium]|nr:three-Cys-motif partner protein TcmP [Gammaproteobacteria bacterium]